MPKLSATVTATTTQEVRLEPKLRKQLVTKLGIYFDLKAKADALKKQMDKLKTELGELRDQTGETSVDIEGAGRLTLVAPVKHTFDAKLFVKNGGDIDIYNQSFIDVPTKSFTKITAPGEKDSE